MPRLPRGTARIRTYGYGPQTGPQYTAEKWFVKKIDISPEIKSLLRNPTWSVTSLLPPARTPKDDSLPSQSEAQVPLVTRAPTAADKEITPEKLRHLLRLSALPAPKTEEEEERMLNDLRDHVHFVKEIQMVDTSGVEPLVAIRDETSEHRQEHTITKESLAQYIDLEEKQGKNGTIRRRKDTYQITSHTIESQPWEPDPIPWSQVEDPWDLGEGGETRKMGRFFFIKRPDPDDLALKSINLPPEGGEGKAEPDERDERDEMDGKSMEKKVHYKIY